MDWAVIRDDRGTAVTFGFLMVVVFLLAVGDGIAQPTLFGISLYLTPQFYQVGCQMIYFKVIVNQNHV